MLRARIRQSMTGRNEWYSKRYMVECNGTGSLLALIHRMGGESNVYCRGEETCSMRASCSCGAVRARPVCATN